MTEINKGCTKLREEEFCYLYSSVNAMQINRVRRIRWKGLHIKNEQRILDTNLKELDQLGDKGFAWKIILKCMLQT